MVRLLLLFLFFAIADASLQIRYLFNNGIPLYGASCDYADMRALKLIFQQYSYRKLRRVQVLVETREMDFDKDVARKHKERQLPYYPPYCKDSCKGFAPRTCLAANCKGYRRNLQNEDRDLEASATCDMAISAINGQLEQYTNNHLLTEPCITLISAPRTIECFDDVVYGEVTSFTAWNGTTRNLLIQTNVQDGFEVCQSANVNFEAVGNECAYNVTFHLEDSAGGTKPGWDDARPFFFTGQGYWTGMNLLPGSYTLKAYPNAFTDKTKQISFAVLDC